MGKLSIKNGELENNCMIEKSEKEVMMQNYNDLKEEREKITD